MLHVSREMVVPATLLMIFSYIPTTRGQTSESPLKTAQALLAEGRLAEAEAPLSQAAASAPGDAQILTLLAELKARLGETQEAVPLFRSAATLQPHSAKAHLNLGIALADTGDVSGALAEVKLAIQLDPADLRARLNLARFLADTGHPSQTRLAFQQAAKLDPSNAEVNFFWASFEKSEQQPARAAKLLAKVIVEQPENGQAYFLLGQCLQATGRNREAIAAWRKAVALNPSSGEEVYALAQALRSVDPAASAKLEERFRTIESEKRSTAQATELGNKAYQAMQQQSWALAIGILRNAIDLCAHCPIEAKLHQQAGLAMCHQGDLDAGEKELRFALSINPDDRTTVQALQWVEDQRIKAGRHPQ